MSTELIQLITSVGSLAVAALAIWVAHKTRQAPLHEVLYGRQLDAALELAQMVSAFIATLRSPDEQTTSPETEHSKPWKLLSEFHGLYLRQSLLLPSTVLTSFAAFIRESGRTLRSAKETGLDEEQIGKVVSHAEELFLSIRNSLGIGGLSRETQNFFAGRAEVRKIVDRQG